MVVLTVVDGTLELVTTCAGMSVTVLVTAYTE